MSSYTGLWSLGGKGWVPWTCPHYNPHSARPWKEKANALPRPPRLSRAEVWGSQTPLAPGLGGPCPDLGVPGSVALNSMTPAPTPSPQVVVKVK